MFASQDKERLYLSSWNYNGALIMGELAKIVQEAGGRVKPARTAVISNRTISSAIREYESTIQKITQTDRPDPFCVLSAKLIACQEKLDELRSIDNTPREVYGQTYIRFVLGDCMYYYSLDDNPFFPFHFSKTPVYKNGDYYRYAYCQEDQKSWLNDDYLGCNCTDAERYDAACKIFEMLLHAPMSGVHRESRRVRVDNRYDGGYHYETFTEKPVMAAVDF